jgi:Uma2 family endonuclease
MPVISRGRSQTRLPPVPVCQFSVEEYHRMIDAGILTEEDQVELLEGWIVPKMPRNPTHDAIVTFIYNRVLAPRLPTGWFCRGQSAITTDDSEPEPDIAVVRGDERDYLKRHPGPQDMALAVEVAKTSLQRDRGLKARIYARAGVPVYWIVNLVDRRIEEHTEPSGPVKEPRYRKRRLLGPTRTIALVLDGHEIDSIPVRDLLP